MKCVQAVKDLLATLPGLVLVSLTMVRQGFGVDGVWHFPRVALACWLVEGGMFREGGFKRILKRESLPFFRLMEVWSGGFLCVFLRRGHVQCESYEAL